MDFQFFEPWHGFLPRSGGHLVAFMGAGGKTTLLRACAEVYDTEGQPCFVAATVPGEPPGAGPCVAPAELAAGAAAGLPPGTTVLRVADEGGALAPGVIDDLAVLLEDHVGLVEVDAAGGRPLKGPGCEPPLWPVRTSLAVVVMGAAAVGGPSGEMIAGFTPDLLPGKELADWSTWEWEHNLALLAGPGGYLDQVPADVPVVLALTGLDLQPDSIGLFDFVGRAMADPRLPIVLFCGFEEGEPRLRAACRADDDEREPDDPSGLEAG